MKQIRKMMYVRQVAREVIKAFERETQDADVLDIVKSFALRIPRAIIAESPDLELSTVPIELFVEWTIQGLAHGADQTALTVMNRCSEKEKDANPSEVKRFVQAVRTIQEISASLTNHKAHAA
jgi:cytochrome P450